MSPFRMGSSIHSVPQGSEKGWIPLIVTTAFLKTSQEAGVGVQMRVGKKVKGMGRREELKIHY